MPWNGVPSFGTSEVLTAAKLNQMAEAVAFLNGLSAGPIPPFRVIISTNNVAAEASYYARHRSNYLHIVTWHDGANRLLVDVAGVRRWDTTPAAGFVDTVLNMAAWGIAVGSFVPIDIEIRANSSCTMNLLYVSEIDRSTSLFA